MSGQMEDSSHASEPASPESTPLTTLGTAAGFGLAGVLGAGCLGLIAWAGLTMGVVVGLFTRAVWMILEFIMAFA